MSLLEVKDLSVSYGSALVLDGISMHVEASECVGVIGPNGAGKTTLLRSISGVKAWGGEIGFKGQSLAGATSSKIVGMGIVQAPEGRHLFPQLSVKENLYLGAFTLNNAKQIEDNYRFVIELFPRLAERSRQMAGTLSGGEQQMVCVGRAMMASPEILMLDEPSFGLAPMVKEAIAEAVSQIRSRGVTILLVEQDANMAFELAQRLYVIEEGTIAMSGSSADLSSDERIKTSYLGI